MEQAVAIMVGATSFVTGLSIFLLPALWASWIERITETGYSAVLTLGMVNITFGTFILAFHWVWSGWAMVLTIIGGLLCLRGLLCLFAPDFVINMIRKMMPRLLPLMRFAGVAAILIALAVLYPVWQGG